MNGWAHEPKANTVGNFLGVRIREVGSFSGFSAKDIFYTF